MKRLLLLPLLCLMPAAQATDYVKCEAMNKAYGRLLERKDKAKLEAQKAVREEACGSKVEAQLAQLEGDNTLLDRYYACTSEWAYGPAAVAAGEAAMAKVQVQIDKVKADYDAEGCY